METKIAIINVNRFKDKKHEGKYNGRVGFAILQPGDSENYRGYSDVACYYNDVPDDFIEQFPKSMFMQECVGTFEERPDFKNRMNIQKILKSIEYNGYVIDLL